MSIVLKGKSVERKTIRISEKRQITIPQKFFQQLGFESEAECSMEGDALVIRPVYRGNSGEFAEEILADLIAQGYSGDALLMAFKSEQRKIRPAVERMIEEADALAESEYHGVSLNDLFGAEDA